MTSPAPFVDVCGFPADGEPVDPTPRAAHHLIAAGWTPPKEEKRSHDELLKAAKRHCGAGAPKAAQGFFTTWCDQPEDHEGDHRNANGSRWQQVAS